MKKHNLFLFSSAFFFFLLFVLAACKKINESTTLGGELIPAIDNINTFEVFFAANTKTALYNDSTRLAYGEEVALGYMNDPEFGTTTADVYFNISRLAYLNDPFKVKTVADSLYIDSVVLSLGYISAYGDSHSIQTVNVYEIAQNSSFRGDTPLIKYNEPDFATTGAPLGSKTYTINTLNDSIQHVFKLKDTTKIANVLRIPLSTSFGYRLASYDTLDGPNGGYRRDSIFKTLFKGFAIKSNASGSGLAYFNLADGNKTKLTIYYNTVIDGKKDTSIAEFYHATLGQANLIKRTRSANFNNSLAGDDKIYIQTTPGESGSYGSIKIPSLDTFTNKVIHRAELIISKLPSAAEATFTPPSRLFLDRKRVANDSAFLFQKDALDGRNLNNLFGGTLGSDGKYHFNITRHVQDIVTKRELNDSLRLIAPLEIAPFASNGNAFFPYPIGVISQAANGRVVVAGGNYVPDPALSLRLRIIYSKIP